MRKGVPIALNPPARAAVFVPGFSTATEGFTDGWKDFQGTIQAAIDPGL
jgi:hypothetical protein